MSRQYGYQQPQWIQMQSPPQYAPYSSQYQSTPSLGKPELGKYTEVAITENAVAPLRAQSFRQKYFGGIKRTLRAFLAVACVVLIINLSWLFYAKTHYGFHDGFGVIQEGLCDSVKKTGTWYHLLINVLSTLLLTGSNAFMATYSCPSRAEVDKAHQRGRHLNVGGLSFGNLRKISKRKGLVVLVLGISSVPFHLLYNSLVYTSIATNQYYWSVVTEDFMTGSPFNLTTTTLDYYNKTHLSWPASPPNTSVSDDELIMNQVMNDYWTAMQQNASSWERLANQECIQKYANVFISGRRNVLLVTSQKNDSNSVLMYDDADLVGDMGSNWWICSMGGNDGGNQHCNPDDYASKPSDWTVWDYPIEYCLSQPTEDTCSINFSTAIMIIVLSFNALKVVLMTWVLLRYDSEKILTSVGDAAASFLTNEDPTTMQMCLADKRNLKSAWRSRGHAQPYDGRRRRWGLAVSRTRWCFFFLLMIFCFCVVLFFGVWGFSHVKDRGIPLTAKGLWGMGFGSLNQNAIVIYGAEAGNNPITMALLANIPQVFLAAVYLIYMGIMAAMFMAQDWSRFSSAPQTLMVSTPRGSQRGTWLLGAPLAWGVALLSLQTLLHWFVSQSLFMIQTTVYDKDGRPLVHIPDGSQNDLSEISNCGYSPIAIIFSIVAAGILLLSAVIFMLRRFAAGAPPVVSTCSVAISAACHQMGEKDADMPFKELRWGVSGSFPNGVAHCSLVTEEDFRQGRAWPLRPGGTFA